MIFYSKEIDMKNIILLFAFLLGIVTAPIYADSTLPDMSSHHAGAKLAAESVDINSASTAQLMTLKGIGEKKAQAIVDYRTAHGSFKSVNDLSQVKGIGAKMVARIEAENPGKLKVVSE
jgi:competence protein ComEA